MPIPLHQVLKVIFRPPLVGNRQIIAVSRRVAEKLPLVDSVAVISITAPEKPIATLAPFQHILRLSFADIDFLSANASQRSLAKVADAFTAAHASDVLAFVERLPGSINSVVVHCEGGYSRSCAIAKGLNQIYGFEVQEGDLSEANPSVVEVMGRAAAARSGRG